MAFFHPSQLKKFFEKYNMNSLLQETGSSILGFYCGLYAYEKREEFFGLFGMEGGEDFTFTLPESWTSPENKVIFIGSLIIIAAVLLIKFCIYFHVLDFNQTSSKKRKVFNLNGIVQEVCTIMIGATIGMFSSPVTKGVYWGLAEKSEYPDLIPAIIIIGLALLIKLLFYSRTINLNAIFYKKKSKKILDPHAIGNFFQRVGWNGPINSFLSLLIGIGIGLYFYHSNIIFWPEKKLGKAWVFITKGSNIAPNEALKQSREGRASLGILKIIFGTDNDTRAVKIVPDSFSEKEKKPYWIIGIAVVVLSVFIKILMYLKILNFNRIRNHIFGKKARKKKSVRRDYNGIIDEVIMLGISMILGVLATPILNNLKGTPTEYPYGGFGLYCLIILILIKIMFALEMLDFNTVPRVAGRR